MGIKLKEFVYFCSMDRENEKLRIDKYLWSIRVFKTRSLAAEACKAGKVKRNGQSLKPSYLVKVGEEYSVQKGPERRTLRVLSLLHKRVDAKTAVLHYQDITPLEETLAYKASYQAAVFQRDRGAGRPTKKDRRDIDALRSEFWEDPED